MDFEQFKNEWKNEMVYTTIDFDIEEELHELYIEYKEGLKCYGKDFSVKQWCEFFHQDCDLDIHPYMLKSKALKSHHSNSLRKAANMYRKRVGLPELEIINLPISGQNK